MSTNTKPYRASRAATVASLDRLPPNSVEAEQGVLGCILLSANDALPAAVETFAGIETPFYDLRHGTIFNAMKEMADAGKPIEVITLQQHLKDKQTLEQVGGIGYLATLPDLVPSAANLSYYAATVAEKATLRKLIQTCTATVGSVYDYEGDVDTLVDQFERDALSIRAGNLGKVKDAKTLALEAVNLIEGMWERKGAISGISTGLIDLDQITDGMHPGDEILITGYPSTGKTSLAMNIVEHVALEQKKPVGVFSLEMSAEQLMLRMTASQARVDLRTFSRGHASPLDFPKITTAATRLSKAPIHIRSEAGLSIDTMRAMARRMKQQHGIQLLVIDYMQLLNAAGKRKDPTRSEELGIISQGCKNTAMELGIPVILLSQLNDDGQVYGSREPGHDADVVMKLKNDGDWQHDVQPIKLLVEKQRNGPTGSVNLTLIKTITRFENAAKFDDHEQ